jgi:hypothetical protein
MDKTFAPFVFAPIILLISIGFISESYEKKIQLESFNKAVASILDCKVRVVNGKSGADPDKVCGFLSKLPEAFNQ